MTRAIGWLPLLLLPAVALACRALYPPWALMWVLALSLWFGFKWLTWWQAKGEHANISFARTAAYLFLWPGMDAKTFLIGPPPNRQPAPSAWLFALGKTILGCVLYWGAARLIPPQHPIITGWAGLLGIVFTLHFGVFNLLALLWQRFGIDAQPIMNNPVRATSLSEFWSKRWNLAFRQLAHRLIFQPLHRRIGPASAMLLVFLASGLIHDLVISVPAQAGYGLPTLYFLLQALGLAIERSAAGRVVGLGNGIRGWIFTALVTAAPSIWLFHPPFIHRVILPTMAATGAL